MFRKQNIAIDSVETKVSILTNAITDPQARPRVITPPGLSRDRQLYFYRNVRPYVRPRDDDIRMTYAYPQPKNESVHRTLMHASC